MIYILSAIFFLPLISFHFIIMIVVVASITTITIIIIVILHQQNRLFSSSYSVECVCVYDQVRMKRSTWWKFLWKKMTISFIKWRLIPLIDHHHYGRHTKGDFFCRFFGMMKQNKIFVLKNLIFFHHFFPATGRKSCVWVSWFFIFFVQSIFFCQLQLYFFLVC